MLFRTWNGVPEFVSSISDNCCRNSHPHQIYHLVVRIQESWMLLAVGSLHSISKMIGVFLHHNSSSNIDQEAGRGLQVCRWCNG
jgi:hypothetical protein